jgi:hypothetical protein
MKAVDLLERNHVVWKEPTRHPFLDAVREGRFPAGAFEAWPRITCLSEMRWPFRPGCLPTRRARLGQSWRAVWSP